MQIKPYFKIVNVIQIPSKLHFIHLACDWKNESYEIRVEEVAYPINEYNGDYVIQLFYKNRRVVTWWNDMPNINGNWDGVILRCEKYLNERMNQPF